jgi:hypothetical protein
MLHAPEAAARKRRLRKPFYDVFSIGLSRGSGGYRKQCPAMNQYRDQMHFHRNASSTSISQRFPSF